MAGHRHAPYAVVHKYAGNGAQVQTCRCGAWRETTIIMRPDWRGRNRPYHTGIWTKPPKPAG